MCFGRRAICSRSPWDGVSERISLTSTIPVDPDTIYTIYTVQPTAGSTILYFQYPILV